ncbi:MAG: hypothetical protein MUF01_17690 [Bryobacterales bacterium]|jgi:hypothetical protein|nr:hypothetical protein [Bryobacterales bacterium]
MDVRRQRIAGVAVTLLCLALIAPSASVAASPRDAEAELFGQLPRPKIDRPEDEEGPRLPSGKLQSEAILEHDHKKNLEDLRAIQKISQELLEELEANTGHVFSLGSLKKMEQMEKLSKQLKNRFKK